MGNLVIEDTIENAATDQMKYLGILTDLKWDKHTDCLVVKFRCLLSKFKFPKSNLDVPQLKIIYVQCSLCVSNIIRHYMMGWST